MKMFYIHSKRTNMMRLNAVYGVICNKTESYH